MNYQMTSQHNRHRNHFPIPPISLWIRLWQADLNPLSGTRQRATSDQRNLSVVFCAEQLNVRLQARSLLKPHAGNGGYFHVAQQQFGHTQDWIVYP